MKMRNPEWLVRLQFFNQRWDVHVWDDDKTELAEFIRWLGAVQQSPSTAGIPIELRIYSEKP